MFDPATDRVGGLAIKMEMFLSSLLLIMQWHDADEEAKLKCSQEVLRAHDRLIEKSMEHLVSVEGGLSAWYGLAGVWYAIECVRNPEWDYDSSLTLNIGPEICYAGWTYWSVDNRKIVNASWTFQGGFGAREVVFKWKYTPVDGVVDPRIISVLTGQQPVDQEAPAS